VTRRATFREGVGFGVLTFGVNAALGVVSAVTVARLYGVSVLGEAALALAPATAMASFSSVREQTGLVRELARTDPRAPRVTGLFVAVFSFSVLLTVAVSLLMVTACWFAYRGPVDAPALFLPALAAIGGYVVLSNSCWNLDMVFSAFRAGRELFRVRLGQTLQYLAFAVAFSFVLPTVWGPVLALVASWATSLAHRLILIRRFMCYRVPASVVRDGFRSLRPIVAFGLKIAPGSMAEGVSYQTGTWTLGVLGSVSMVGAYNRAWMVGSRFLDLKIRITEMLLPTLVERRDMGDHEGFDRALVDSLRYATTGMLLLAGAIGGVAPGVMALFGPGFDQASNALTLLMLFPLFAALGDIQFMALWTSNRAWLSTSIALARAAAVVGLSILLTAQFGITGTAMALSAAYGIASIVITAFTRSELRAPLSQLWRPHQMLAVIGAYIAALGVGRLILDVIPGIAGVIPGMAGAGIAFLGVFLVLGGSGPRDRERLRSLVSRVRLARARQRPASATTGPPPAEEATRGAPELQTPRP
jgi:O-antigen/teichoic acid export membrane protein